MMGIPRPPLGGTNGPERDTKSSRATGVPSETLFARHCCEINDLHEKNP